MATYKEYGSLRGILRIVDSQMVVVDRLTDEETPCFLQRPELEAVTHQALDRRVEITGEILVDRETRKRIRILADKIRILRERADLPQIEDLFGIDITGGIEPSEYIRRMRDEE